VAEDREVGQSAVVEGMNFGVWLIWEYFEVVIKTSYGRVNVFHLVLSLLCSSLLSLLIVF
jgi:hypothetical protein